MADEKTNLPAVAEERQAPTSLKLRLPYPRAVQEQFGVSPAMWQVFIEAIWPSAKTPEGVYMAISYCKARNLDPMKKMVHIVPVWSNALKAEVETVWPGIAEIRTTATRTGVYAGKDAAEFGPNVTQEFIEIDDRNGVEKDRCTFTFPEWCRVTVYKIVQGIRCQFVGPKVVWEEAYATKSRFSPLPNEMWGDRRSGQLEKCAEAAALRAAFPEELGNQYTAEEMHGRVIDGAPNTAVAAESTTVSPPRPKRSEFERKVKNEEKTKVAEAKKADSAKPAAQKQAATSEPVVDQKPAAEKSTSAPEAQEGTQEPQSDAAGPEAAEDAAGGSAAPAAEAGSGPGPVAEMTAEEKAAAREEQFAEWLAEKFKELEACNRIPDVADLSGSVVPQLSAEQEKAWNKARDARTHAILSATSRPKTGKK